MTDADDTPLGRADHLVNERSKAAFAGALDEAGASAVAYEADAEAATRAIASGTGLADHMAVLESYVDNFTAHVVDSVIEDVAGGMPPNIAIQGNIYGVVVRALLTGYHARRLEEEARDA